MKICRYAMIISLIMTAWIHPDEQKVSTVSGRIKNQTSPHIFINNVKTQLDSTGSFNHTMSFQTPSYVAMNFGQHFYLYLHPGDAIHIEADAEDDISKMVLSGDRIKINQYLIDVESKSRKSNAEFNRDFVKIMLLNENDYQQKINQVWKPFEQLFEQFVGREKIKDRYFIRSQEASLLYSKTSILIRYPEWHRNISGNHSYRPSDHYFDFLQDLDINDEKLLENKEFADFLNHFLDIKTGKMLENDSELDEKNYKTFRARQKVILETFSNEKIKSLKHYQMMSHMLNDYYHKNIDDMVSEFRDNCSDTVYLSEIEKKLQDDQNARSQCEVRVYKKIGDVSLDVFIYRPADLQPGEKRPALAFFHGGGWECGKPEWGQWQCQHYAQKGFIGVSFEYRLVSQHDATPLESIADAKSAIRWMRKNADELGIDPDKIAVSGFSAGGHLALCTTMIDKFDEPGEDLNTSTEANAFILWSSASSLWENNYFKGILKGRADPKDCDPAVHIHSGLPPAIIFHGDQDEMVSVEGAKQFARDMQAKGNRCDIHIYKGQTHLGWGDNDRDVMNKMDGFLQSLGIMWDQ